MVNVPILNILHVSRNIMFVFPENAIYFRFYSPIIKNNICFVKNIKCNPV